MFANPHRSLDFIGALSCSACTCDGKGVVASAIPCRQVSPCLDQDFTNACPVPGRREHQWCEATIVAGVQVITTSDVQADCGLNASDDCHFQQPIERAMDSVRRGTHAVNSAPSASGLGVGRQCA
jgi:hypothetical protein